MLSNASAPDPSRFVRVSVQIQISTFYQVAETRVVRCHGRKKLLRTSGCEQHIPQREYTSNACAEAYARSKTARTNWRRPLCARVRVRSRLARGSGLALCVGDWLTYWQAGAMNVLAMFFSAHLYQVTNRSLGDTQNRCNSTDAHIQKNEPKKRL